MSTDKKNSTENSADGEHHFSSRVFPALIHDSVIRWAMDHELGLLADANPELRARIEHARRRF